MKLYTSVGPNPAVVSMFLSEKGLDLPREEIDLRGGENRREPYISEVNPAGQTPALMLDDGSVLTEIIPICEYIEELHPEPALIGSTPKERAETRMWTRRVDLKICEPMLNGFRYSEGLPLFESRMRCLPEAAEGLKAIARDGLEWLEGQMEGRTWLAGERFTLADIMLFVHLQFASSVGQPIGENNKNILRWYEQVSSRSTDRKE